MEKLLDTWRRIDELVGSVERLIVTLAVMTMVLAVFAQSILRFFFEYNLYGASNWATVLLVWVGFFSASLAAQGKKHIVVDIVPKVLGDRRVALLLSAVVFLMTAMLLAYLFNASWGYLNSPGVQFRRLMGVSLPWQDMPLETKYIVVAMPVALGIMTLRFFQIAVEEFSHWLGVYPLDKRRIPAGIDELIGELGGGGPAATADTAEPASATPSESEETQANSDEERTQ